MEYLWHLTTLIAIYSLLIASLDLVVGQTGMFSLAHAGFYGLGAYGYAIAARTLGWDFVAGAVTAAAIAALLACGIALICFRIREDFFAIATFSFQMVMFSLFNNLSGLTGGPSGIAGIPAPRILGQPFEAPAAVAGLAVALGAMGLLVVWRLRRSPFGRVLIAIREDEVLAGCLGRNVAACKVQVFALSAALAALAGACYAGFITYIHPANFGVGESVFIVSGLMIGGSQSLRGACAGAALLVLLPEALRMLGVSGTSAAALRQMLYGGLLVLLVFVRPQGLLGRADAFHR